ncbi:MAG: LysE family transporter [Pseudoflavonifractor sp.]|nr:LysE family transporter [Alloprevotella sp.]MCM1116642.1 LysE family transporter [Pseudoflavonifractor sp.]
METILYIIFAGIMIGILISAPMGPIGVLVIQRTLNRGRRKGLATGLGASLSDIIYCLLTAFGLSFVNDFIASHRAPLQLAGSLVLVAYGIFLFLNNPSRRVEFPSAPGHPGTFLRDFATGFLLTFSNPLILFFIIGLFARFNFLDLPTSAAHYVVGFLFIAVGAVGWWTGITYLIDHIRGRFTIKSMRRINRAIAVLVVLMAGFGLYDSLSRIIGQ